MAYLDIRQDWVIVLLYLIGVLYTFTGPGINLLAASAWAIQAGLIAAHAYYVREGGSYFEYLEIMGVQYLVLIALLFVAGTLYAFSVSNSLAIIAWGSGIGFVAVQMYHSYAGSAHLEYFNSES